MSPYRTCRGWLELDREPYLVSSSVMEGWDPEIGALSDIRLTGVKESDWYIEKAAAAVMKTECWKKYNEPDYELILKEGSNFALENTMIGHNPEVGKSTGYQS